MPPSKMNGIDTMSKGELVILCEKLKLDDAGKTVAQMRTMLKKYYEENDDDEPSLKKPKVDPMTKTSGPPLCPKGDKCPELHAIKHRQAFKHTGYRDNPIKCRDGMGCSQLKDSDHLVKYAHDDDLDRICKDGAACALLHDMEHRVKFEHPGFRAQPFECRNGMACSQLHDRAHLYKYAHKTGGMSTSVPAKDDSSSVAMAPPPTSPKKASPKAVKKEEEAKKVNDDDNNDDDEPKVSSPKTPLSAKELKKMIEGKSWDDFPLDSAPETLLIPVDTDSEEFWDLEEKFAANMQGRNEDYVAKRIKAGKKPLRFILVGAERCVNPVLEARFELKKAELLKSRDSKDVRERVSFHGTHPKNVKNILRYSLLRFKHPLNPCKTQVDSGYFGSNQKGIYVSRYADYTLKYSNRVCPVEPGDEVKTILFRTLPGKSLHIEKMCGPIEPTKGYDSHSSPTFLEWYLFDESQACPSHVLKVKAMEDTRTAADDE